MALSTVTLLLLLSAAFLLVLKIWNWYETHEDWKVAQRVDHDSGIYMQARGEMRMAWLRLVKGVLWFALAYMVWDNPAPLLGALDLDGTIRLTTRLFMGAMIWLDAAQVLTERLTQYQVTRALDTHPLKPLKQQKATPAPPPQL